MSIEARAIELDEARKARILKSETIDVEKYDNDAALMIQDAVINYCATAL